MLGTARREPRDPIHQVVALHLYISINPEMQGSVNPPPTRFGSIKLIVL